MSAETLEWLNTKVLVGYTAKRGEAWHYRADLVGAEPNHYADEIPIDDVKRRLLDWDVQEAKVVAMYGGKQLTDASRKAIVRPPGTFGADDPGEVLAVHSSDYVIHPYRETLLHNIGTILDDGTLHIGSAGLLRSGGVAFVQVEVPDTIEIEGTEIKFRPFLSAATSVDGSLKTTYTSGAQVIVCDNTLSAALAEGGARHVKVRHTKNSLPRVAAARDALGFVHKAAENFESEVRALLAQDVEEKVFQTFLDIVTPLEGLEPESRSLTLAHKKRDKITHLYKVDPRCAPWTGTAFGVLQTMNTYLTHEQTVRGASRLERNTMRGVQGTIDAEDSKVLETLEAAFAAVA